MIQPTFEILSLSYIGTFFVATIAAFMFIRSFTTHTVIHHKLIVISSLILILGINIYIGITVIRRITGVPKLVSSSPKNAQILSYDNPKIQMEFSDPVVFSKLNIHTFPERELEIQSKGYFFNMIPIGRTLTVIPKKTYPLDTSIMIYISNTTGPMTRSYGGETLIEFFSETKPKIISIISPTLFTDVSVSQDIRMLLDKPSKKHTRWFATSNPETDFSITEVDNELILHPIQPMKQGVLYTLSLYQREIENIQTDEPAAVKTFSFTTTSPPFVSGILPSDSMIYPSQDLKITFKQPMDIKSVEERFTLIPDVSHTFQWNTLQSEVTIKHATLSKNSTFSAQISTGTKTRSGGILEQPLRFDFRTPGFLDIESSIPTNGQKNISLSDSISIFFNQPITVSSPISKSVTVHPDFKFFLTASQSSLRIQPTEKLKPDTTYSIQLSPSVVGTFGLPPTNPLSFSFTTQPVQTKLIVPFYKQESSFTCNIAAARMLLAYKQIFVSEKDIITSVGSGGKRGKGNPNVGYIDDYGTYWEAVSIGISRYSKNTILQNGSLKDIISLIISGKPVMIWGQNGWSDPHEISWTSTTGEFIRAINGMHSSVVTGFMGTPDNPTEIYLNDPWRGQYAISTVEFLRRWGYFSVALSLDK